MKRFLSALLVAAMLLSVFPTVFADTAAEGKGIAAADTVENDESIELNNTEEDEITEPNKEDNQDEEKTDEQEDEQISVLSAESGVSVTANDAEEVEVEYTYYKPQYVEATERGTLQDALTAIGESNNSGKIKLLKDIAVRSTINVKLEELDGNNFTITRADGFTGEIVNHSSGTLKIHDITLDGESKANIQSPLIVAGKGSGLATNLILNKVTLKNNFNVASNSKGGAIYAEGAAIGQTTSNDPVFCENVTVENCSAVYGGAIYNSACDDAMYFLNSEFRGNKADTGSALYIDYGSDSRSINLDNCSFTDNDFVDSTNNTKDTTKKTVVYTTSSAWSSGQLLYMSGETEFSNTTGTVSDVMLDGKLATSSKYCNFAAHNRSNMIAMNNVGSNPIRVAFSDEVIEKYSGYIYQELHLISLIEEFSMKNLSESFTLVQSNNGKTVPEGYKLLRHGEYYERYATIGKPRQARVRYNIDSTTTDSYKTKKKFEAATEGAVTFVTAFPEGEIAYSETAYVEEDNDYKMQVKANGANITEVYATYHVYRDYDEESKQDVYDDVRIEGKIDVDAQGATLDIPMDNCNDAVADKSCDIQVYVLYGLTKKDITVIQTDGGTVATNPTGSANVGSEVAVNAEPNEGYALGKITVKTASGKDVPVSIVGKFTMPAEAVTVSATFVKKQFTVTASEATSGTITIIEPTAGADGTHKTAWGENVKINVAPKAHYKIDTVIVDGKTVEVDGQGDYTFEMPTHNVTVSATFKKIKYTITGAGERVTFAIPSSDTYDWDDTVKITVTPEPWYTIKSVYADNSTVNVTKVEGEENTYSFIMPKGDITITALTERPNFNVTFDSKGGSNVTTKVVANGDAVEKPEVPVWAGRGFAGWYLDEAYTNKYDFTKPVTGNVTLYARWFLWGDVNGDGVADTVDALLIQRCRVGLTDYSAIKNRIAGLVNEVNVGRNYPDSMDAVTIQRYRVGLINRYRVEDSAAGYEFDLENDSFIPKN